VKSIFQIFMARNSGCRRIRQLVLSAFVVPYPNDSLRIARHSSGIKSDDPIEATRRGSQTVGGVPYESHFTTLRTGGMGIQSLPFLKPKKIPSEGEEK